MTRKHRPKNPQLKAIEKEGKKESILGAAIPINLNVNNQPVKEQRLGRFAVSAKMLDMITFEQCQEFFSHFVIIGCNFRQKPDVFVYLAFSPLFEPYETKIHPPPQYKIDIKLESLEKPEEKMKIIVTATKVEKKLIIVPGQ